MNKVANTLQTLGVIIILIGAIGGWNIGVMNAGYSVDFDEINWSFAITAWIWAAVSGMSLIGFAQVINLLESILRQLKDQQWENVQSFDKLQKTLREVNSTQNS